MQPPLLIALIMITLLGSSGVLLAWFIRRTDPHSQDPSEDTTIRTAQEFLPFEDIREDMILLGRHRYRAVLSCTSTSYHLKTAGEKDAIEMAFQRFLNSISFPVTFFLQTRVIDNTRRLQALEREMEETVADFPSMAAYARQYLQDMSHLSEHLGNSQQKRRYLIVTCDCPPDQSGLTDSEKEEYAVRELRQRCALLSASLETVGVTATRLDTREIIELIYACYRREDYSYAREIAKGDCFATFVEGEEDRFRNLSPAGLLEQILGETEQRLRSPALAPEPAVPEILARIRELRQSCAPRGEGEEVPA